MFAEIMYQIIHLWIILLFCISQAALKEITIVPASSTNMIPCKEDWYSFGEKCYRVFEEKVSWLEARRHCSRKGGSLVTIKTPEQLDFLTYFLLFNAKTNVWIGLHDRDRESDYTWDDGSRVSFTNWQRGEPTGYRNYAEDCVEMMYWSKDKTGQWNDIPCDYKLSYMCQATEDLNDTQNHDPRFCSDNKGGGVKYAGSCYQIVTQEKTWEDAEKYCKDTFNAHLVTILNYKTQMFLNYMMTGIDRQYWIGVKIRSKPQQKWTSGWHVVFNRWDDDPEDFEEGNCGLKSGENSWTLAPCVNKFPFICETSKKLATGREVPDDWLCPNTTKEWKDLDGDTCYFFETKKSVEWYEANYACSTIGGVLARIDSERESKAMHPYVQDNHESLLIGLHRRESDRDTFQWPDGSSLEYENWNEGEPNSYSEKCGELLTDTMKWNDIPCDIKKGYICSAKKVPPDSRSVDRLEVMQTHHSGQHSHLHLKDRCPSHTGLKAALGIFVSIFVLSIVIGAVMYFNTIRGSAYARYKN